MDKKTIVLGVTGSIAAYKSADIVNRLTKSNFSVNVIMTKSAAKFITPLTLQTLSKNKIHTDIFAEDCPSKINHISLAQNTDLLLIAPATANTIGKLANGIADDMITCLYLAVKNIPILIAPAMNSKMYENQIVTDNITKLLNRGCIVIEPKISKLACGDIGKGALADVDQIIDTVQNTLLYK